MLDQNIVLKKYPCARTSTQTNAHQFFLAHCKLVLDLTNSESPSIIAFVAAGSSQKPLSNLNHVGRALAYHCSTDRVKNTASARPLCPLCFVLSHLLPHPAWLLNRSRDDPDWCIIKQKPALHSRDRQVAI